MGYLIHACFLIVQHHRRHGRPIDETFQIACEDVYLKSRSLSYDQQEIVSNTISHVLTSNGVICEMRPFYVNANTQNVQFNSTFYMVQQQATLILLFSQIVSEYPNSINLSELLFNKIPISSKLQKNFDAGGINIDNLLLYSVLKFYDEAFVHDVKYRHFWLTQLTGDTALTTLSENLSNLIADRFASRKNQPWDLRRMPVLKGIPDDTVNRISLLMNYLALKHRHSVLDCYPVEYEQADSLRQYSRACIESM